MIYTVHTRSGVTFHIQASNHSEAKLRAESPAIGKYLAQLMQEAVRDIATIKPHHGPERLLKYPVFRNEVFK